MIYYAVFLGGILIGSILSNIIRFEFTSFGILDVDHQKGLVGIRLNSGDFLSTKKKKIVLKVNHSADLLPESQE